MKLKFLLLYTPIVWFIGFVMGVQAMDPEEPPELIYDPKPATTSGNRS